MGCIAQGGSPTPKKRGEVRLSPFRWLDVVLSLPSHQVRRCGEIGGGRYVTVGLLLARAVAKLVVLVLRLGREVRHSGGGEQVQATGCIAQVGLFSQKGAGGVPNLGVCCPDRRPTLPHRYAASQTPAGPCERRCSSWRGAVQARGGSSTARGGLSTARGGPE